MSNTSRRPGVFYAVMLCMLLPIAVFAILGVRNERPTRLFYWHALTGERPSILAFENGPTRAKLYCFDFKNGTITTRPIGTVYNLISISNFNTQIWAYDAKQGTRGALQLIDMQANDAPQIRNIDLTEQENSASLCVVDNHIMRQRSGRLESTDFIRGTTTDSIPCPITGKLWQEHIRDTKSFLVSDSAHQGIGDLRQQFLFKVSDGKLHKIASWSEIDHCQFTVGSQSYILSLLDGGVSIEVRNASSGDVVASYLIPQVPTLASSMTSIDTKTFGESWIHWRGDPLLYTDALTGKSLPVPAGSNLIQQDIVGNRLITICKSADGSTGWDCSVVDATSGDEICRFGVAVETYSELSRFYGGVFMTDANQLVFATQDCRLITYDITTGKLIRSFDPLLWADWCSRLATVSYVIWCFAWLRVSPKLHPYGWVDLAICSGLVVAHCCYQLQYNSAHPYSLFVLFGIFGSWTQASVAWLIFGNHRWSLRVQPLILILGITTGIIALSTTREIGVLAPFVVGLGLLVIVCLFVLLPFRFLRFRFANNSALGNSVDNTLRHRASAVALRDVFSLTMACALVFAVARWLPAADWSQARLLGQISIFVIVIAISSLLSFWTAFGRSTWIARWGICMGPFIGSAILIMTFSKQTVPWLTILSAVVSTLFCFNAYRLRGWRLDVG